MFSKHGPQAMKVQDPDCHGTDRDRASAPPRRKVTSDGIGTQGEVRAVTMNMAR
jgi:hypothetical protein